MAVRPRFPDLGTMDYWRLLLRKMPPGLLWAQQRLLTGETYPDGLPVPLTRFGRFLLGLADELARVHNRWNALVNEAFPATADETLPEWERDYGLPEFGYVPQSEDPAELLALRRVTLAGKVTATGGASGAYFEALAAGYGFPSVTTEDGPWPHWWTVHGGADVDRFCAGDAAGDALVEFAPDFLPVTHIFTAYRPASKPIWWDE